MEGSLRQVGSRLRLGVQLLDALSGAHLWAENYERTANPETVFELQDDLVARIVSTVADVARCIAPKPERPVRQREAQDLSPYEAVLRSFTYAERGTPEALDAALLGLETAVQRQPAYADAWAIGFPSQGYQGVASAEKGRGRLLDPENNPRRGAPRGSRHMTPPIRGIRGCVSSSFDNRAADRNRSTTFSDRADASERTRMTAIIPASSWARIWQ